MNTKCKQFLLKQLMIRFDYKQVQDLDIENAIISVREKFLQEGFSLEEGQENQFDYTLKDPQLQEEFLTMNRKNILRNYGFIKKDIAIVVNKEHLDITLNISDGQYSGAEFFCDYSMDIINAIKSANKYINIVRAGIRKINTIVVKDISKINDYFQEDIFTINRKITHIGTKDTRVVNSNESFSVVFPDMQKANINAALLLGQSVNEISEIVDSYQAILDIDAYIDSIYPVDQFQKIMENLNNTTFNVFKNSLNEEFYDKLLNGNVNDDNILGGIIDAKQ